MSGPYVYVPEATFHETAYYNQAHSPYGSPFVPDGNLQPSPYSNYGPSLPPSPNLGGTPLPSGGLAFPGMGGAPDPVWDGGYRRPRQNSWHGNPYANPPGLLMAPAPAGHHRSNSFGHATSNPYYPPTGGYYAPQPPMSAPIYSTTWNPNSASPWFNRFRNLPHHQQSELYIHPWLNGEAFRNDFMFNLALPHFAPLRVVGPRGETALLGPEELSQPATYPSIHKLTITCDPISQWPIELVYHPVPGNPYYPHNTANMPPITVGNILMAIHRELHRGIVQYDWGGLSTSEAKDVKRAYLKRCRSAGPQGDLPLQKQGVKRVDFLKRDVWFKGLVRTGDGLETLTMITGS